MEDPSVLMWSVLFGSIGFGYLIYGKRQRRVVPLVTGLLLMAFPYFVSGSVLLVVVGSFLLAVPYIVKKLNL